MSADSSSLASALEQYQVSIKAVHATHESLAARMCAVEAVYAKLQALLVAHADEMDSRMNVVTAYLGPQMRLEIFGVLMHSQDQLRLAVEGLYTGTVREDMKPEVPLASRMQALVFSESALPQPAQFPPGSVYTASSYP